MTDNWFHDLLWISACFLGGKKGLDNNALHHLLVYYTHKYDSLKVLR